MGLTVRLSRSYGTKRLYTTVYPDEIAGVGFNTRWGGYYLALAKTGEDTTDSVHRRFGPDWYCSHHGASFEAHEARNNDGDCPWCGRSVDGL